MIPQYIDIHSHLNDKQFDGDRDEVIKNTLNAGVWTITIGTDKYMSQKACDITEMGEGLFASIGVHPTDNKQEVFDKSFYIDLAQKYKKVVAVGECGLEYFRLPKDGEENEKKRQKNLFEAHIDLAVFLNKPLMIHCREAYDDLIDILRAKKREYGDTLRGNVHFFAGDIKIAKKCFELDFTISFTGVITFAYEYDDVIKYAPLEKIMVETDAPYVAPVPHRGRRCEPLYVSEVAKRIALIRGEDENTVAGILVENARKAFDLTSRRD